MIWMGVDPSSSVSGICVYNSAKDKIIYAGDWIVNPGNHLHDEIYHASDAWGKMIDDFNVEGVVIEKVSVSWNVNTIRKIAYYEAAAMHAASNYSIDHVYQVQATKARRIVLGKGNLSKEACFELVKEMEPKHEWTMDSADAYILARAGDALREGA